MARLENTALAFGDRVILKNCSLDIVEGAVTCIIGLSGAGKSTILRLIDGLLLPSEGHVFVRDQDICHVSEEQRNVIRQKISLSFQFSALLDSLSVGDNVALPLREHTRLTHAEIHRTVMDALDSVGLANAYDALPGELSGGMLKRAGFARAIVTRPELVLYDEPTTGLDPIVTNLITDTILKLRDKLNGTAVVISHDLESIFAMADYVAMLFEGAIIAYDTAAGIRDSTNPIVQQFLAGAETGPIPI
ncbi:MAG: ATP-binding cassette domain-containing protein [Candidatus Eremiobacteraeota bacterium]|nr:ATP-binding cassette domain-containing protein [Candidatus Eremiobacteraeota bacterium]